MKDNLLCLCVECHNDWHAFPKSSLAWFIETFGQARYDAIIAARNAAKRGPR